MMRLWDKLRRIFTLERLVWCCATVLVAAVFLTIGLTAPRLTEFAVGQDVERTNVTTTTTTITTTEGVSTTAPDRTAGITTSASTANTANFVVTTSSTNKTFAKIPINTATKEQLMTVPGIGEAFSQRIIDYRNSNGGFKDLSELMIIQGIGEKRYNQWKEYFTLD